MIANDFGQVTLAPERLGWEAHHDEGRFGGPGELLVDGLPLVQVESFQLDDMDSATVSVSRTQGFRKSGAALVRHEGLLPFGETIQVAQTCRYAANHVRITFDLNWPRATVVRRHFGVGGLFLPGVWKRYYLLPACAHLGEGARPGWHPIPAEPAGSGMAGHWHRPPLALVFEREDGMRLEVGTGADVWRWEQCLGCGPEAGSYKIMQEPDGLRVLREPLMTCEEFMPEKRQYRLTWHLAWQRPGRLPALPTETALDLAAARPADLRANQGGCFRLDPARLGLPETCLRQETHEAFLRNDPPGSPCWFSNGTQKAARKLIRSLANLPEPGTLVVGPLAPAPCWVPGHCDRKGPRGIAHWDLDPLLDFAVWTRQQLGPAWTILPDSPLAAVLPSVAGLFGETGFAKGEMAGDGEDDE